MTSRPIRPVLTRLAIAVCWVVLATEATASDASTPSSRSGSAWMSATPLAIVRGDNLVIRRSGTIRILPGLGRDVTELAWSRDATLLGVEQQDSSRATLTTVSAEGGHVTKVGGGASLSFAWSATGHTLYFATGTSSAGSTLVEKVVANGRKSSFATAAGSVLNIASSSTTVAISSVLYLKRHITDTLALYSSSTGRSVRTIHSASTAFDIVGFAPTNGTLLVGLDEDNSASIAEDGVEYETISPLNGALRHIGIGLENRAWQSWGPTGMTLAITLGDSRAAWATDKHVVICSARSCAPLRSAKGTISFAPNIGADGRIAYATAEGLGGASGFGRGVPSGGDEARAWQASFRVWVSSGAHDAPLKGLDGAGYPQWVGGGPGLLVEQGGSLWYLSSRRAKATQVTDAFLQTGYGNYGNYDFDAQYALAP